MGISIFVILSVIGLVALAVVVVTPPDPGPRFSGRKIELHDILAGNLKPRYFNGTWISGKVPFFLKWLKYLTKIDSFLKQYFFILRKQGWCQLGLTCKGLAKGPGFHKMKIALTLLKTKYYILFTSSKISNCLDIGLIIDDKHYFSQNLLFLYIAMFCFYVFFYKNNNIEKSL